MKSFRSIFLLFAMLVIGFGTARSQQFFTLALDGSDPSQTVTTPATGSGWAILSADKTRLTYTFAFARLTGTPTAAHFHYGSRGRSGGVAQTVVVTDNYVSGAWSNITSAQADSLLAGRIYLNIHSAQFPNGEIRGQVNPIAGVGYAIGLNGGNQSPAITTTGRGAGYAVLWTDSTLRYRATVTGLSANLTAAHFHNGAAGISGGVAQLITFSDSTTNGSWKLTATALDSLRMERLYMNVHTSTNPNGEIRGQVRNSIGQFFALAFDGSDPGQTVSTPGTGSGWAVLSADRTQLNYTFAYARMTGAPTVAHFHYGKTGTTGGVAQAVVAANNYVSASWNNITSAQADSLLTGRIYLNIHSAQFPSGEIRAQVNPVAASGYAIALNGNNQAPAVSTPARGAGYAVLWTDSTLRYRVTVTGLSANLTAAHFHNGAVGVAGGVAQAIAFPSGDSTSTGSWKLAATNLDSLRLERYYVNVHTTNNPNGEIRGQVRPPTILTTNVRQFATLDAARLNVRVTPNPVAELVTMSFALPQAGRVTMRIYDALGRAVSEAVEGAWAGGTTSAQFNVSGYNNGVYYCRITLGTGETTVQGFVVAR